SSEGPSHSYLVNPKNFSAHFGKHNSTAWEEFEIKIPILNIVIHPKFVQDIADHDIALVKLQQSIQFSSTVRPMTLSNFSSHDVQNCSMAGWGRNFTLPEYMDPNTIVTILDIDEARDENWSLIAEMRSMEETIYYERL
uniref:Peptidase S1 domain-containing protein n=1 Tax=Romanomermis culicivorax TaxID=13658 RepID=A0A915JQI5_ROMCU